MKNKKNILATVFTLIFALGVVPLSAAAATTNSRENDPVETLPEIVSVNSNDDCGVPSIENFVRNLDTLTVEEKAALLADLGEIAKLEKQIDAIYGRITDENADRIYDEIDVIDSRITAILEKNTELWERVCDEYDEQIAVNDPDMAF